MTSRAVGPSPPSDASPANPDNTSGTPTGRTTRRRGRPQKEPKMGSLSDVSFTSSQLSVSCCCTSGQSFNENEEVVKDFGLAKEDLEGAQGASTTGLGSISTPKESGSPIRDRAR